MNLEEALKVSKVVELAEGGCSGCMSAAVDNLKEAFPEFNWKLIEIQDFSPGIDVSMSAKTLQELSEPVKYNNCGVICEEWVCWNKLKSP